MKNKARFVEGYEHKMYRRFGGQILLFTKFKSMLLFAEKITPFEFFMNCNVEIKLQDELNYNYKNVEYYQFRNIFFFKFFNDYSFYIRNEFITDDDRMDLIMDLRSQND